MSDDMLSQEEIEALLRGETLEDLSANTDSLKKKLKLRIT